MSEINVKVNSGPIRLFDIKVHVDLKDTVLSLKRAIHKKKKHMVMKCMTIMYCGNILDDSLALYTCGLFSGSTVYVFQKIKSEKKLNSEPITDTTVEKLAFTFDLLWMNPKFRYSMIGLCKPEKMYYFIGKNPGLIEDPVALTLFQHPRLFIEINDNETIKNLAQRHPALSSIMLQVNEIAEDILSKQSQPSTSGVSTSTESTENAQENAQSKPSTAKLILPTQLQRMRNMGFTNEAVDRLIQFSFDMQIPLESIL